MAEKSDTVYIVDDNPELSSVLAKHLAEAGLSALPFPSAVAFLAYVTPETRGCVLLDLKMPGMDGLKLQAVLAERNIDLPLVFMSGYGKLSHGVQAMKQGARDFLEKPFSTPDLLAAVAAALEEDCRRAAARQLQATLERRFTTLTAREQDVFLLVVQGLTNRQTGERLHIAEKTVKVHRARVMAKMEADSLPHLVRAAQQLGHR